ncbi:hypothetical protein BGZ70_005728, partial [Mortierella alpina]
MSITSDNGSNVLKLTSLFEDYTRLHFQEWRVFKASEQHVPCLAHVLNLAVQAILGKEGLAAQAPADAEFLDVDDDEGDLEGEQLIRASISEDEPEDAVADQPDVPPTVLNILVTTVGTMENSSMTQRALVKLRKGIVKIRRSPPRLEKFKEAQLLRNPTRTKGLCPKLDVCTRWGSTYDMIERALQCKDAYVTVLVEDDLNELILEDMEWRRLTSLRNLLHKFDHLTTQACASKKYATIPLTIIIYNKIMSIIEDFLQADGDRTPDLCRGVRAAYDKLKKYYTNTDSTPIYAVATALHPAMRFKYWAQEEWEPA